MNIGRFSYTPPWQVTRWGFVSPFKIQKGCDEWHNPSYFVVIPLLGVFVWFPTLDRSGEEHVSGWTSYGGYEGRIAPGCEECKEFVRWVEDERSL